MSGTDPASGQAIGVDKTFVLTSHSRLMSQHYARESDDAQKLSVTNTTGIHKVHVRLLPQNQLRRCTAFVDDWLKSHGDDRRAAGLRTLPYFQTTYVELLNQTVFSLVAQLRSLHAP